MKRATGDSATAATASINKQPRRTSASATAAANAANRFHMQLRSDDSNDRERHQHQFHHHHSTAGGSIDTNNKSMQRLSTAAAAAAKNIVPTDDPFDYDASDADRTLIEPDPAARRRSTSAAAKPAAASRSRRASAAHVKSYQEESDVEPPVTAAAAEADELLGVFTNSLKEMVPRNPTKKQQPRKAVTPSADENEQTLVRIADLAQGFYEKLRNDTASQFQDALKDADDILKGQAKQITNLKISGEKRIASIVASVEEFEKNIEADAANHAKFEADWEKECETTREDMVKVFSQITADAAARRKEVHAHIKSQCDASRIKEAFRLLM